MGGRWLTSTLNKRTTSYTNICRRSDFCGSRSFGPPPPMLFDCGVGVVYADAVEGDDVVETEHRPFVLLTGKLAVEDIA